METAQIQFPNLPPRLAGLGEIASNLWWSWHPAARMLSEVLTINSILGYFGGKQRSGNSQF